MSTFLKHCNVFNYLFSITDLHAIENSLNIAKGKYIDFLSFKQILDKVCKRKHIPRSSIDSKIVDYQ